MMHTMQIYTHSPNADDDDDNKENCKEKILFTTSKAIRKICTQEYTFSPVMMSPSNVYTTSRI